MKYNIEKMSTDSKLKSFEEKSFNAEFSFNKIFQMYSDDKRYTFDEFTFSEDTDLNNISNRSNLVKYKVLFRGLSVAFEKAEDRIVDELIFSKPCSDTHKSLRYISRY